MMHQRALYGVSIVLSFTAWGDRAILHLPHARALRPILVLHGFRVIGLAFLVSSVISPDLPIAFAHPAAYGDLIATVLALLSLATLQSRLGIFLVWVFNFWGTADLLYAFYQGNLTGIGDAPGQMGAAYLFRRSWYLCS